MSLTPRLPYFQLAPKALQGLIDLSVIVRKGSLDSRLLELVSLRVSQINGCAWCVDAHWSDLVRQGLDVRHINAVAAWREAPFFSAGERAALGWAEAVTGIPRIDPFEAEFDALKATFDDAQIAELGFAIATFNAWNLLNVSFRNPIPEKAA